MCIRLISSIIGRDSKEMVKYTDSLGAAFQIQDDLIALISEEYAK